MSKRKSTTSEVLGGMIALGAIICVFLSGAGLLVVSNVLVENNAVNPVPVQDLGLSPEHGENLKEYLQNFPGTDILGASSDEDNRKKRVSLDPMLYQAAGNKWPFHGPQLTGDCSAFASAGCGEYTIGRQFATGDIGEWHPICRMAAYAQGRFEKGKRVINGDGGSDPALQVENFQSQGVLFQDYDDVPAYSKAEATKWGREGVPQKYLERMGKFKVKDIQRCKTAQGVCNQIVDAKNPVFFGSFKFGTTRIKLLDSGHNLAIDNTAWPHAQMAVAYDGTVGSKGLFRIMNSWGAEAHNPKSKIPEDRPGGYYVTWDVMDMICGEGMCFAMSEVEGFTKKEWEPDFHILGSAADRQDVQQELKKEEARMFPVIHQEWQSVLSSWGWVLMVSAVIGVFLWFRHRSMGKLKSALLLTCLFAMSQDISYAIDFGEVLEPTMSPVANSSFLSGSLTKSQPVVRGAGIGIDFATIMTDVNRRPEPSSSMFSTLNEHINNTSTLPDPPVPSPKAPPKQNDAQASKALTPAAEDRLLEMTIPQRKPQKPYPIHVPHYNVVVNRNGRWVNVWNATKAEVIEHLRTATEHRNDFVNVDLEKYDLVTLLCIHDDDHEGKVDWEALGVTKPAKQPAQPKATQPQPANAQASVYFFQSNCPGGVCPNGGVQWFWPSRGRR